MEHFPNGDGDDDMDAERDSVSRGTPHEVPQGAPPSHFFDSSRADKPSIDAAFLALAQHENNRLLDTLPDLSVDTETARDLKRRRWYGVVEVKLPGQMSEAASEFLEDFVADHLSGREPLPLVEASTLRVTFATRDQTDEELADVFRFAEGLAHFLEGGTDAIVQQRVTYLDTTDYDHLGPEERFPFSA